MAKRRVPKYSLHKATNQARVFIDGRDHYLDKYGSEESKRRYQELVDKWRTRVENPAEASITIGQLVVLYHDHVANYYVKDGKPTSEVTCVKYAVSPVVAKFSKVLVADFGPSKLQAARQVMVTAKWSRKTINKHVARIIRMFRWAVSQELCRPEVVTALECVEGLRRGGSGVPEDRSGGLFVLSTGCSAARQQGEVLPHWETIPPGLVCHSYPPGVRTRLCMPKELRTVKADSPADLREQAAKWCACHALRHRPSRARSLSPVRSSQPAAETTITYRGLAMDN